MTDSAEGVSSTPLVGRDGARETLLQAARGGLTRGGAVLVSGEAGLGKTTLLTDVAGRLPEWTVVRVHADSFESDLSFATVDTLLRALNGADGRDGRDGQRIRLPRPEDEPLTVGRILLDAVEQVTTPVCLIVDDAQWVDDASARALRFVVRRLAHQGFLFIAATRPLGSSVLALFDDFGASNVNHARVELQPLTASDTQTLALHILGHAISRRTATSLTEATHGSPLLVSVLLRHLRETFTEALHPAGWDLPVTAVATLSTAVGSALEGAEPAVREASELVAVLRDPVPLPVFGTIAATLDTPADAQGAVARGLVHASTRDGVVWLEPAHALLADALTADLPLDRRVAIHRVAAEVLTGHRALRHRVEAADVADPTLVTELLEGSRRAADRRQADQAMSYARSAVHLAAPGAEHDRALLEIGLLAMRTRLHERIFDLMPAIEAIPASAARDAVLLELRTLTGDIAGALALASAIQAGPARTPDERAVRAHVAEALPKVLMATRDFGAALAQLDIGRRHIAASPRPDEVADPALRWLAQPEETLLRLLGWSLTAAGHAGRPEQVGALVAELDELLAEHESPAAIDALVTRAGVFVAVGDIRRAREDLERANDLVRAFPGSWTAGFARTIHAHVLFLVGEWDASVTLADTAVALALDETDLSCWPIALSVSALVRAGRGETAAVEERLRSAAHAAPGILGSYDGDLPFIARAELARARQDPEAQLAATEQAEDAAAAASTLGWLTYRVDALAALERGVAARAAYERCLHPEGLWRPYYGSLGWLEGRVLEAEGRPEEALAAYVSSLDGPEDALFPFPHAVAALDAGRLLATLGTKDAGTARAAATDRAADRAAATAHLERAAETFRRIGASGYLARCAALLDAMRTGAETPADPFAALTTRERQVAHAAAAGLTNKEIAERLYVSVTTVNFHVRNILAKLELRSRRDLRTLGIASRRTHAAGVRRSEPSGPGSTDRPVNS